MPRVAVFAALLLTAACGRGDPDPIVGDAWVRHPAVAGRPGAAYFTIRGGSGDDRLVSVRSAVVDRIELHESGMAGGMMTMKPLADVTVRAGTTVRFAPGGNHAMLFGIDRRITPGTALPMAFRFASGKTVEAEAKSVAAGAASPYE